MKLSPNAIIADAKITKYLLSPRSENEKSKFLGQAGYNLNNWQQLKRDLFTQILTQEAQFNETTRYGDKYQIKGTLTGPNGTNLPIVSIWMVESVSGLTKFITLFPERDRL